MSTIWYKLLEPAKRKTKRKPANAPLRKKLNEKQDGIVSEIRGMSRSQTVSHFHPTARISALQRENSLVECLTAIITAVQLLTEEATFTTSFMLCSLEED